MVDPIRRKLLKTGAAVAAMAATPSVFAQQTGNGESGRFYQKGNVRIRYEETGSGFPLLLIAGGACDDRSSYLTGAGRDVRKGETRRAVFYTDRMPPSLFDSVLNLVVRTSTDLPPMCRGDEKRDCRSRSQEVPELSLPV